MPLPRTTPWSNAPNPGEVAALKNGHLTASLFQPSFRPLPSFVFRPHPFLSLPGNFSFFPLSP